MAKANVKRVKYSDWENQNLQSHVQQALGSQYDLSSLPGWLVQMFPEYAARGDESGNVTGWMGGRDGATLPQLAELQRRVGQAGGNSAIGFDPQAMLSALQQKYSGSGLYTPDAEGYMYGLEMDGSSLGDIVEMATPFALMAATAFGGNALAGQLGATTGANALAAGADLAAAGSASTGATSAAGAAGAGAGAGAAAGGGPLMPAAVPPVDPTFGGALTQVAPGVWSSTGLGTAGALAGGAGLAPAGTGTASAGGSAAGGAAATGGGVLGTGMSTGVAGIDALLSNPQVLGMAGGALLGGLGGGSEQAGTTTTETDMPDWLKAYVKPALDKYSTMVQNYNTDPYGVMPAAMDQFRKTVAGDFLDPSTNKYLENYFNAGAERVKGTLSPSFGHMQAFGGHSGYNEALSRGLGDLATGLYGQAYENERSRMNAAIGAAPSFLQASSQQAFAPYQGYLSTLGGLKGSKTTQPYFQGSDWQNILGGAMTGWGLGNLFKT